MPEAGGSNIEVAHHLSEHKEQPLTLAHDILEIAEAIVLAVVAIATAWSGYQAALWTGHQAELYGLASRYRVQAEGAATAANQERLYNASTLVEWLKAEANGQRKLSAIFERRFLPEFRPAFESWKKTDPLNNPDAPAGPFFMPEYRSAKTEEAARLNDQATESFEQGNRARQLRRLRTGDGDAGHRPAADCHQPTVQGSCCAGWPGGGRRPAAVPSDLPYPDASTGLGRLSQPNSE